MAGSYSPEIERCRSPTAMDGGSADHAGAVICRHCGRPLTPTYAALREDVDGGWDFFLRGSSPIDRAIISRITSELPA